jgi:hypothetical protein
MNRVVSMILLGTLAWSCAGCIPIPLRRSTSPGASGTVLDSNGQPIPGARVIFSNAKLRQPMSPYTVTPISSDEVDRYLADTRKPLVFTGKDGKFRVRSKSGWYIYFFPTPQETGWMLNSTLVIQHDGFKTEVVPISSFSSNPMVKLDPISLKPNSE